MVEPVEAVMVSWYSAALLRRLIPDLRRKAAGRVDVTVVDNSGGRDEAIARLTEAEGARLLTPPARGPAGSHAHARALSHAVARSGGGTVLILDPDVHLFLDRWDRVLQHEMERSGAAVLGAPYPWWKLGKYHDFPAPVFLLAQAETLRALGNDWSPFAASAVTRGAHRALRQVVRLGGIASRRRLHALPWLARLGRRLEALTGVCAPDTGYRLAAAARRQGLPVRLLTEVEPAEARRRWGQASALADVAREFELFTLGARPVLAHRYSTASRVWRTDRSSEDGYWHERISRAEEELVSGPGAEAR